MSERHAPEAGAGWLNRREYPFRSRWWHTDAGRMHYVDEGSGEPIVFVHGVPAWSYSFRDLIRRLSHTHRCVAMDHLGFGLSDKPAGWPYEPQALAAHLEELITGLELRNLTPVVHDWGGPLGVAYALRHPRNVARLVLFNTWMWSAEGELRARIIAWLLASPLYLALEDRFAITARLFTRLAIGADRTLSAGGGAGNRGSSDRVVPGEASRRGGSRCAVNGLLGAALLAIFLAPRREQRVSFRRSPCPDQLEHEAEP